MPKEKEEDHEKKSLTIFLLCSIVLAGCNSPLDGDDRPETQSGQNSSVSDERGNVQQLAESVELIREMAVL